MMKIQHILSFFLLTIGLYACSNGMRESDYQFEITGIQSEKALVNIVPKTSAFYYVYGVVPMEEYTKYRTDRKFIDANYKLLLQEYDTLYNFFDEIGLELMPIEELMFDKGLVKDVFTLLEPETEYCAFIYSLNDKKRPLHRLIKRPFTTPAKPHSDLNFSVHMKDNETIAIHPSNDDTYFWEIATRASVIDYLLGGDAWGDVPDKLTNLAPSIIADLWFFNIMADYYMLGFTLTTSGTKEIKLHSVTDYLYDGDVFYLGCVGYENEMTTEYSLYRVVYHMNQPSEIHRLTNVGNSIDDVKNSLQTLPVLKHRTLSPAMRPLWKRPRK